MMQGLGAWAPAAPAIVAGVALLLVPGALVRLAGWPVRSLTPWFFAPALSIAVLAVASNGASALGIPWSLLPVAGVTAVAALAAFGLRRWVGPEKVQPLSRTGLVAVVASTVAAVIAVSLQLVSAFGRPEEISQTFDNIVHLNAVRMILDAGDAGAFTVGRTSDIGFYPNGWHSLVSLVVQTAEVGIPVGVNAADIALGAVAWPLSCLALAAVLFRERTAALVATAALSTGFAAFPLLLMSFGVLYPNATAYAVLPAGLAALLLVLRGGRRPEVARSIVLLLVVTLGIGLAHPNAFLALYAMGTGLVLFHLGRVVVTRPRSAAALGAGGTMLLVLVGGLVLWRVARTGSAMSGWPAWGDVVQALVGAATMNPRAFALTVPIAVLALVGIGAIVVRPLRYADVGIPFAIASFLFIAAAGVPAGTMLRDLFTNPWYNDPNRLAALIPVAGVPVAALGALVVADVAARLLRRVGARTAVLRAAGVVGTLALFTVAFSPNVLAAIADARISYTMAEDSALLDVDERALLDRLDDSVPDDALIIANPWTGGSLAYALADRDVLSLHVFGTRSADEEYVDHHLADIDADPEVCAAVARLGVDYVLDFGTRNVFSNPGSGLENIGLNDLSEGTHLQLVDEEGDGARLFRIVGC